ncbi:MAG: hypothetical protein ACC700_12895, partial [Anaerolineales bacterium]
TRSRGQTIGLGRWRLLWGIYARPWNYHAVRTLTSRHRNPARGINTVPHQRIQGCEFGLSPEDQPDEMPILNAFAAAIVFSALVELLRTVGSFSREVPWITAMHARIDNSVAE